MKVTELALKEVGTQESPIGSNNVKYNTDYYGQPVSGSNFAWCASFLYWLLKQLSVPWPFDQRSVYCPFIVTNAQQKGLWTYKPTELVEGDFVLFGTNGRAQHIGLVIANDGNLLHTVEGNTGDKVQRKAYAISQVRNILGGVHVTYPDSPAPLLTPKDLQQQAVSAINYLVDKHRIDSPDVWLQRIKAGDDALCWLFIKWRRDVI